MNLKTIADKAGVSTATVSNVINGNNHKVSEKTRQHVLQIIKELNYSPSATARSLASNESRIIALFIPNMLLEGGFGVDPYASQMISLLEQVIRQEGYYLMMRCADRHTEITQLTRTWNADGIILIGAYAEEVRKINSQLTGVPVVYIDTYAPGQPMVNVGIDDYRGGFLSAQYLLERGHRRIAYVGPDEKHSDVIRERFRGLRDAMNQYGLKFAPEDIFLADTSIDAGVEVGNKIFNSGRSYTAVAAMSDTLALGLSSSLQTNGLMVPDDISLIGFDNVKTSLYASPPLTTVAQNLVLKASLVGEHLFRMIRTKQCYSANAILDVEVIERGSVRCLSETKIEKEQ